MDISSIGSPEAGLATATAQSATLDKQAFLQLLVQLEST